LFGGIEHHTDFDVPAQCGFVCQIRRSRPRNGNEQAQDQWK
jgi:hypothetical protein